MLPTLRFLGLLNVAVWLGSAFFFTLATGPAVFSTEMRQLLGTAFPAYSGAIAQIMIKRYFLLQYWCSALALVLYVAEALYTGRPWDRRSLWLLCVMLAMVLAGGLYVQPKLRELFRIRYAATAAVEERTRAAAAFRLWHGISQGCNLLMALGVIGYFWRVTRPPPSPGQLRSSSHLQRGW